MYGNVSDTKTLNLRHVTCEWISFICGVKSPTHFDYVILRIVTQIRNGDKCATLPFMCFFGKKKNQTQNQKTEREGKRRIIWYGRFVSVRFNEMKLIGWSEWLSCSQKKRRSTIQTKTETETETETENLNELRTNRSTTWMPIYFWNVWLKGLKGTKILFKLQ